MKNVDLVERMRTILSPLSVSEQRMFGGTCFMLNGNMVAGTLKGELLVRVGKDRDAEALARPHARRMEMGRPAPGYVVVGSEGTARDKDLDAWLARAVSHVGTLPAKEKPARAKKPARPRKAGP
jgi:TfoX/Sxy family transcriptional regulator of competence genes